MPLNSTETSLCNKLVSDYGNLIGPVKTAKSGIMSQKNALTNLLNNMNYSAPGDLSSAINGFIGSVAGVVPNPNDLNSLANFLNNCDFFKNLGAAKTTVGLTQSVFSKMASLISGLKAGTPEFAAGDIGSTINSLLGGLLPGGLGITEILNNIDKLLNCLNSVCAAQDPYYYNDLTFMTNEVNGLYSDMGLVSGGPNNGKFDYDTLYSSVGMTPDQITAINSTVNVVDEQKAFAKKSIDDTLKNIKSLF